MSIMVKAFTLSYNLLSLTSLNSTALGNRNSALAPINGLQAVTKVN